MPPSVIFRTTTYLNEESILNNPGTIRDGGRKAVQVKPSVQPFNQRSRRKPNKKATFLLACENLIMINSQIRKQYGPDLQDPESRESYGSKNNETTYEVSDRH